MLKKKTLVKNVINSHSEIIPDYHKNTLTVKLYTQASPRMNVAIEKVCELLN